MLHTKLLRTVIGVGLAVALLFTTVLPASAEDKGKIIIILVPEAGETGWTNIDAVNGVDGDNIDELNQVTHDDIAEINGITVD
jgi:hypothetical protein